MQKRSGMNVTFSPGYIGYTKAIERILQNFENEGTLVGNGKRNTVKYFDIGGFLVNIKSFVPPNTMNRLVYKYFRKSKARRSFEYAGLLLSKGFHTPQPIAYLGNYILTGLTSSFYICEQLQNVFSLQEVIKDPVYPQREAIIRKYTQLFFQLHEHGIEFIDNSPGNILLEPGKEGYRFFLVDLNRMNFPKAMTPARRLHNFSRLTLDREVLTIISDEYAKLANLSPGYAFTELMARAQKFQKKSARKKYFKNKLKFYRSSKPVKLPV